MKLNFETKTSSQLWLTLEAVFGFTQKKFVSYHAFGYPRGVFENQFQRLFQIDNFS